MALISLSFKKIYKPTNNNLRTSSNISRANHDNTPRINKGIAYDNQRVVYIAGDRENAGTQVVQQSGIQCYNCKKYGHVAREYQKPKRAKDAAYHNEKMLLYQELEAHYLYMAHIQEVNPDTAKNSGPIFDAEPFNFVEKFLGAVKFGNDQIATILDYGDMVQRNGNDLLTCSRGTDLYSITLQDTSTSNPICLMAKATSSQAWLWHRHLSHLNFDTINLLSKYDTVTGLLKLKFVKDHLCSSCELGKAKRKSFKTKTTPSSKRRLQILHMDLCGPMRDQSFNGKKYVLVIVDGLFQIYLDSLFEIQRRNTRSFHQFPQTCSKRTSCSS
ncbi:retrovirus-related pol polyprotein from transposon TNT 1-94 [Tanacetum coccineum]